LFTSITTCNKHRLELKELKQMNEAYRDTTKHWKNKYEEEVASRKAVEGNLANIKTFFTKAEMDSLEKRFDTKFENLRSLIKISTAGHTTLPPVTKPEIVYVDSSGPCAQVLAIEQRFANPYYKLHVRVGQGAWAKLDAYDTITIATKRAFKRKFLSKQWYTQVDAISANDSIRSTVQGAFVITDQPRVKYLEVFGQAGYRYFKGDSGASSLYGGLGATYKLKRIDLTASYNRLIGGGNNYFIESGIKFVVLKL
jgi:hypothetical protein